MYFNFDCQNASEAQTDRAAWGLRLQEAFFEVWLSGQLSVPKATQYVRPPPTGHNLHL